MKYQRTKDFLKILIIATLVILLGTIFFGCDVNETEEIPLSATGLYKAEFSNYKAVLFLIESGNATHGDYDVQTADLQLRKIITPNISQTWHFSLKGDVSLHTDPFVYKVFKLANEGDSQYDSLIVDLKFDGEKLYGLLTQKQEFIQGWRTVMSSNVIFRLTSEESLEKEGFYLYKKMEK